MPLTKMDHALDAAARGLPVFPQEGKRPSIRSWPDNATLKTSVIERWWTRWPDADIGISLPADIYVLDADTPDAYHVLVSELDLPKTLAVDTARGQHRYFRVPAPLARMTGGGRGLRAIEGKGRPGPVTWAGSVHPTGFVYRIAVDAPIHEMPGDLVRAIGPKLQARSAGEATRDEQALWLARHTKAMSVGQDWWLLDTLADARAELRLALRMLRSDLPEMPTGWADRFFAAGAYLGPCVASGTLGLDEAIGELTAVFTELDTQKGEPEHVLRSIRRGVAVGARGAGV